MSHRDKLKEALAVIRANARVLGTEVAETAAQVLTEKLADLEATPLPEEQRKHVTVLFADIHGFTEMSSNMDPEDLGTVMRRLWEWLDGTITRNGGTIDKHIGDSVMALFGTPIAREDDPVRAVQAALDMQAALTGLCSELGVDLAMRIGIHTGPVILGSVGSMAEYTAYGDTVNVASRLEEAAPVGGVLVSRDTWHHARGVFDGDAQEPIKVKGKADALETWVIRGRAAGAGTGEPRMARMVGRQREWSELTGLVTSVVDNGRGRFPVLVGEAGVGKSRLLRSLMDWMRAQSFELTLLRGRVTQETGSLPYGLLRDVLSFVFGMLESDHPDEARAKLVDGFRTLMGAGGEKAAHFIGQLVGYDFSDSKYLADVLHDARRFRTQAYGYVESFLISATRERPVVIVLEDVHWADQGSLDLLAQVTERFGEEPLFLMCVARPQLLSRWAPHSDGESRPVIELRPLSASESGELVEALLDPLGDVPATLRDRIIEAAEGNPFYIEELVQMLIDDGVVDTSGPQWTVVEDRLKDFRVPSTLTAVIQARVDALPVADREVLQRAAVIGRVFWKDALETLSPEDDALGASLRSLCERGVIFERTPSAFEGSAEYAFKHSILHEVVYESVLLRRRAEYHAKAAAWLIQVSGNRADSWSPLIARHLEVAGNAAGAGEWYVRAGSQAQESYSLHEATQHYHKALALLGEQSTAVRLEAFEGLGRVLRWQARFEQAADILESMTTEAVGVSSSRAEVRAWIELSIVRTALGAHRRALEAARQAVGVARERGSDHLLVPALLRCGWCYYWLGHLTRANDTAAEACRLAADIEDAHAHAQGLSLLGMVLRLQGENEASVRVQKKALRAFRRLRDRTGVAWSLNRLGEAARDRGALADAEALFGQALDVFGTIGDREGELVVLHNSADTWLEQGDDVRAVEGLEILLQTAPPNWIMLPETRRLLAVAYARLERREEALREAQLALELAEESDVPSFIEAAWRTLGWLAGKGSLTFAGRPPLEARDCFEQSLQIARDAAMDVELARTLRARACFEIEHGDRSAGAAAWDESREIFQRLGMHDELVRMREPGIVAPWKP